MDFEQTAPRTIRINTKKLKEQRKKREFKMPKLMKDGLIKLNILWNTFEKTSAYLLAIVSLTDAAVTHTRFGDYKLIYIPAGAIMVGAVITLYDYLNSKNSK